MRNVLKLLLLTMGLSGCVSSYATLDTPDTADVFSYAKELERLSGAKIQTGADLVFAAYVVVDNRCQTFFDSLEKHKAELLFAQNATGDATSLAVQILTQLTIAQRDIGIVAASGKFVSDSIKNYNTIFNFAPYSGQLYRLVGQAQADYKNAMLPRVVQLSEGSITDASVFFDASNVAQGYGRSCSYSQFQMFVETALNNANAEGSQPVKPNTPRGTTALTTSGLGQAYLPPYVAR